MINRTVYVRIMNLNAFISELQEFVSEDKLGTTAAEQLDYNQNIKMERCIVKFEDYFRERMKDPEFAEGWEESQIYFRFAEKFHEKRNELGLTIQQLAKRCNVTEEAIEDVEFANFENLDTEVLERIAKGLELDIEDFVNKTSSNKPSIEKN